MHKNESFEQWAVIVAVDSINRAYIVSIGANYVHFISSLSLSISLSVCVCVCHKEWQQPNYNAMGDDGHKIMSYMRTKIISIRPINIYSISKLHLLRCNSCYDSRNVLCLWCSVAVPLFSTKLPPHFCKAFSFFISISFSMYIMYHCHGSVSGKFCSRRLQLTACARVSIPGQFYKNRCIFLFFSLTVSILLLFCRCWRSHISSTMFERNSVNAKRKHSRNIFFKPHPTFFSTAMPEKVHAHKNIVSKLISVYFTALF